MHVRVEVHRDCDVDEADKYQVHEGGERMERPGNVAVGGEAVGGQRGVELGAVGAVERRGRVAFAAEHDLID